MQELRTSCSRATSRHHPRVLIHTGRYEISSPEGPEELLQHMSTTEDRNSSERCHYPRPHSPHSTWKAINVVVKGLTLSQALPFMSCVTLNNDLTFLKCNKETILILYSQRLLHVKNLQEYLVHSKRYMSWLWFLMLITILFKFTQAMDSVASLDLLYTPTKSQHFKQRASTE